MNKKLAISFKNKQNAYVENEPETREARTLASVGMSMEVICKETGLKEGQVRYRLAKEGILLRQYRNKQTPLAKYVVRRVGEMSRKEIKNLIVDRLQLKK